MVLWLTHVDKSEPYLAARSAERGGDVRAEEGRPRAHAAAILPRLDKAGTRHGLLDTFPRHHAGVGDGGPIHL